MGETVMTVAQAIIKFLDQQYVEVDGVETKFVEGIFTIFGHGNVLGIGQALDNNPGELKVFQGRNEQGMAHVATAFAKQNNRKKIIACTSSIGPGAANMITAAACATVNNIPLLLLPGDSHATRQPDPVLQQLEQTYSPSITTNDAFRTVCKYWDRIERPEQLMISMIQAMRVLTDPAETGAVCIALPQDVQGEAYAYPEYFFKKRIHRIVRAIPAEEELKDLAESILKSKRPLVICGGGVRYSEAGMVLEKFCSTFKIPFTETQAGKSACRSSNSWNLGGIGVTGNLAANTAAMNADFILAVGSRLTDFTTGSKWQFRNSDVKIASINVSKYHAEKMDALPVIGDAKKTLELLRDLLLKAHYQSEYGESIDEIKACWEVEMDRLSTYQYGNKFCPLIKSGNPSTIREFTTITGGRITQTQAISLIRKGIECDAVVVGAAGSIPGDLQRMWRTDAKDSYHMEYGYSCMGYEIPAALGVKLAQPKRDVYAMCGDGSFLMLHSELVTALQENIKIHILLFDNCGFGCINNLQMSHGIGNLATEFRYRKDAHLNGNLMTIDYAKIGEGYGLKTYRVKTEQELVDSLNDAKKQEKSVLIDIKVLPKTMTDGYDSWWNVGMATVCEQEIQKQVNEELLVHRNQARKY